MPVNVISRRMFLALSGAAALTATTSLPAFAASPEPLPVVASFSILADMVKQVGGDLVDVASLVPPGGDAHVYEPTPADARRLREARLLVVNGLGFEGWLPRLLSSAEFSGNVIEASAGIKPLPLGEPEEGDDHHHEEGHDHKDDHKDAEAAGHDHAGHDHGHGHGDSDPHAWQDLRNGIVYVRNIAEALAAADPAHADEYRRNADGYAARLRALDDATRARFASIPRERRKVVTSHDAFGYFGAAYGIDFIAPLGASSEAESSAADIARIIDQIRDQGISAVFVESISNRRLIDQITRETGAAVGGTLYSDALSGPDGPAPAYLDMFRHNAGEIARALGAD